MAFYRAAGDAEGPIGERYHPGVPPAAKLLAWSSVAGLGWSIAIGLYVALGTIF
jgi:hypothetical protein